MLLEIEVTIESVMIEREVNDNENVLKFTIADTELEKLQICFTISYDDADIS